MKHSLLAALSASLIFTGCASVELASPADSQNAKAFKAPQNGNAGLYVYRNSLVGKALKKDIWVDGKCLGESAPDTFFYTEVTGNQRHKIETESEFSPNVIELNFEAGQNYFVRQFIKLGAFVGGADLEQVSIQQGQTDIATLSLAKAGNCSTSR